MGNAKQYDRDECSLGGGILRRTFMNFYDKNKTELKIGDHIIPDNGKELVIVSIAFVPDCECECMFGQQVEDPLAFSLLTQENLSAQWTKK